MKTRETSAASQTAKAGFTIDRRSFLKIAGFTVAAVTTGCQRAPEEDIVPHLRLDPEVTPGTSTWYAGTCATCSAGCGVLLRTRDNRPVKIEGNPQHPLSRGGLCAAGQAALLGLYDTRRLRRPWLADSEVSCEEADAAVRRMLAETRARGGRVRLLSSTVTSPTLQQEIDRLLADFPDARHVMYDAVSLSAMLDAHEEAFGRRVLPRMHIDRADMLLCFDADFLGTWLSPVEHAAAWRNAREADEGRMSHHVQVEGRLSLTGSNADERIALNAADRSALLAALTADILARSGAEGHGAEGSGATGEAAHETAAA
ncbi:MAG: [Fe-S]-binding protein, partial [Bacteroidota bacterium]|nr:[Fe-S]-binding protein [Bacteroidota bacterium]